jgi:hypothetical protein
MKNLVLFLPLAALTLCGCHRNAGTGQSTAASGTGAPTAEAQAAQSASPLPPPPPNVTARADNTLREAVVGEVDAFLTEQLRAFVQQKGRLPGSFAEFAGLRLDSIPRPPEGRKWAIDGANLEVKAVPGK